MKRKILAVGLFSVCCLGLFVGSASALFDHWLPLNARHRYVTHITCRPYNAFTPICWGNLVCDGCCPSPCAAASGCMPLMMGAPPWCCNYGPPPMPYMGAPPMMMPPAPCGMDGCCASDMHTMQGPMQMPMQPQPQPSFTPPMPMPNGPNQTMLYPQMPNGIAQAAYFPNYYPGYYPMPMQMQMPMQYNSSPMWPNAPVPYYWYNNGR